MGVEVDLYALPADWFIFESVLSNEIRGDILQNIQSLFSELRDGERGEEWLDDFKESTPEDMFTAMQASLELVKQHPHLLGIYFDGSSRGHDHWVYLFELAAENDDEVALAHNAIFASQQASPSATASQGAPINWSNPKQVSQIHQFIGSKDNQEKIKQRFEHFPKDRAFYKRRGNEQAPALMSQLGLIRNFYEKAARYNLSVVSILD